MTVVAPVSVVVPTHRRPEMMRLAVQSVLAQDYAGDVEVLIVFDGCPVQMPDIDVPSRRSMRGIANDRTQGLAGARNTGILAAAHRHVAFLDDDDAWLPPKLTAQMALFEADPELVLVCSGMRVVRGGRSSHVRLAPREDVHHEDLVADRIAALHSSSFVFRRDALVDDVGLIDEALPGSYGEDYDVLLRTARVGSIRVVNEPLIAVRWTGQSYFYGQWATYAAALTYLLAQHPEFEGNARARSRIQSQIAFALAASGQRKEARSWARRALSGRRRNLRAWLALAVSVHLVSPTVIARAATTSGRGI
ncbi:glycosyltransferase family 2 protein [Aeromicrobium sp. CF3.5]|uniref:glycosyltransferase family 2 protein n=1 Tax=Aeromicrobium sp. CF3.5 TaxID=3373078 RepID=UPI003EE550E9